jgi:integrase
MPRTSSNPRTVNRTVRAKLSIRRDPYWHLIAEGQHIGYRKGAQGGTWIARLYDPTKGRRFHALGVADDTVEADGVRVLSFSQAQEAARRWFAELGRADAGDVLTGPYTVRQAMDDYLADRERIKRKPLDRTRAIIHAHIVPSLGHIDVSKLTHGKVKAWRDSIAEAPPRVRTRKDAEQAYRDIEANDPDAMRKRQATANRILTVLKAALNYAHENRRVSSKAAWEAVKPFREVDLPKVRFLTPDEVTALINACEADFQTLVKAALLTGCRYGELTAMSVDAFNPDNETIFVEKSKNGKARHVALNGEGVAFFSHATKHRAPSERMFLRANGRQWKTSEQKRPMDKACSDAKVGCVTFHILRHTYASLAVMNGVPIAVVAEQLGHKDTRITERHYAHLCRSYKQEIIRANLPSFGFMTVKVVAADASVKRKKGRILAMASHRRISEVIRQNHAKQTLKG